MPKGVAGLVVDAATTTVVVERSAVPQVGATVCRVAHSVWEGNAFETMRSTLPTGGNGSIRVSTAGIGGDEGFGGHGGGGAGGVGAAVLVAGPVGSGKRTLVAAFAALHDLVGTSGVHVPHDILTWPLAAARDLNDPPSETDTSTSLLKRVDCQLIVPFHHGPRGS
jgi:hypothetical protein